MTKLQNLNGDKNQQLTFWQNSKTQIVMKLKKSNIDKTKKILVWQNSKSQLQHKSNPHNVREYKIFSCDKPV